MINTSYIYVLHFHAKLSHAKHYVGCTASLRQRLTAHANGAGARLMEELQLQGMTWELGGLYSCSHAEMRRHEKALKRFHNASQFCQICNRHQQHKLSGTQKENIDNVPFSTYSGDLVKECVDIATVQQLSIVDEDQGMKFILSLMRKDKDALGFVPIGGVKGIHSLVEKGQVLLAYENAEPCGYTFFTKQRNGLQVNIHQACVADDARLKGHGQALVAHIAAQEPEAEIVAKVRDDLAANHFWQAIGFINDHTKTHKTSGSTIHHYRRKAEKGQSNE